MLAVALWHVTVLWFFAVPLSEATASLIEWPMTLARSLSLFFLMAGFFGAALYARWGLKRFTRDRLKRIALPLVVGLATIVPVTALLLDDMLSGTPLRAGAMHLWFLWYVVLFYAALPLLLKSEAGPVLRGARSTDGGLRVAGRCPAWSASAPVAYLRGPAGSLRSRWLRRRPPTLECPTRRASTVPSTIPPTRTPAD
jgi:Acyltransferase family